MPRQTGERPLAGGHTRECCRTAAPEELSDDPPVADIPHDLVVGTVAHYTPQSPFFSLLPLLQLSGCLIAGVCVYLAFFQPQVVAIPDQFRTDMDARRADVLKRIHADRTGFVRVGDAAPR